MLNELKKHKHAYTILVMGILTAVALYMGVWPDRFGQRIVILFFGIFYFCWGVITHFKTQFITRNVLLEYAGVSLLGVSILLLLTI
jgi:lipopolysaccharide export LptBFGC system permease protein LptF